MTLISTPLHFDIRQLDKFVPRLETSKTQSPPGEGAEQSPPGRFATYSPPDDPVEQLHAWSMAIAGPDGCGKSILAMHAAASYWRETHALECPPKCIYVSTDLSFGQAVRTWKDFGLHLPWGRLGALRDAYKWRPEQDPMGEHRNRDDETQLQIVQVSPRPETGPSDRIKSLAHIFNSSGNDAEIYFIDLQQESAGDDWGFINRLLGSLDDRTGKAPHLLIVDAIEGLELLSGARDAYGERRTRRSRVAQLVRSARRQERAHLVLVIEETRSGRRLPEQFVADMVVRLRQHRSEDYLNRTIEVEKCRGVPHVRGEHNLVIRKGAGASTGKDKHIDEPEVKLNGLELAHFHITESLHNWNAEIRGKVGPLPATGTGFPTFGKNLNLLVNLLRSDAGDPQNSPPGEPVSETTTKPSITLLLGDAGTYKSRLAMNFLAQVVVDHSQELPGSGVLFTTSLLDSEGIYRKLHPSGDGRLEQFQERIRCRRLSVRYEYGASIIAMVESYIAHCKNLIRARIRNDCDSGNDPRGDKYISYLGRFGDVIQSIIYGSQESDYDSRAGDLWGRIRIVIDDLSLFFSTHPNVAHDPLFLQSLLFLLKNEQVTGLIVATQPGRPVHDFFPQDQPDLRQLDEKQILTWSVPFFGERRVAVTSPTPGTGHVTNIYELGWRSIPDVESSGLYVDPHFLLYSGLEEGRPARVPLLIRLFTGFHTAESPQESASLYASAIKQAVEQVFPQNTGAEGVIHFEPIQSYDQYAAFAGGLKTSRLDYTLVLQVDEFWSPPTARQQLMNLRKYFCSPLKGDGIEATDNIIESEYERHFIGKESNLHLPDCLRITSRESYKKDLTDLTRQDFHILDRQPFQSPPTSDSSAMLGRVPYLWDFGFILARRDLWSRYFHEPVSLDETEFRSDSQQPTVRDVWDALVVTSGGTAKCDSEIDWDVFFAACRLIAHRENIRPFHVDTLTSESLLSLVFEVWGSLDRKVIELQGGPRRPWLDKFDAPENLSDHSKGLSIRDLVIDHLPTLYGAMVNIASVCGHFRTVRRIVTADHKPGESVAERHWYSTASVSINQTDRPLEIMKLPGSVCTRGDWYLSVAASSRSELLATQALDLLSCRRMSLLRLHSGVGLPTRDVIGDDQITNALTALHIKDHLTEKRKAVTLGDLYKAAPDWAGQPASGLSPLFRSRLKNYKHQSFYFRRFVARLFEEVSEWYHPNVREQFSRLARAGETGFFFQTEAGDDINDNFEKSFSNSADQKYFRHFRRIADVLLSALPP